MFANCSDSRSGSDSRGGGGVDFLAGFLLGSAVVGALAYVYAPQVSVYIYIYIWFWRVYRIFCSRFFYLTWVFSS